MKRGSLWLWRRPHRAELPVRALGESYGDDKTFVVDALGIRWIAYLSELHAPTDRDMARFEPEIDLSKRSPHPRRLVFGGE